MKPHGLALSGLLRAVLLLFSGGLLLSGCAGDRLGSHPPEESPPLAYEPYRFRYPKTGDPWARVLHLRRVLEDRAAASRDPFPLLGNECGTFGRDAAAAWLSQGFLAAGLPGAEPPLRAIVEAGVPGPETSTFELALAVHALAAAVRNKDMAQRRQDSPPLAGGTRGDLLRSLRDLSVALSGRQEEDGTWGGAVDTAWAMAALFDATETSRVVSGPVGEGWKRVGLAVLDRWWREPEPGGLGPVERIHRTAAVWIAGTFMKSGAAVPPASWYQSRSRDLDPEGDADVWFASAFLWMLFTPSKDADHPLQGCKSLIRDAYLEGRLIGRSPVETLALTAAIESFGWDAFGFVLGYLPEDNWPTPGGD